MCGSSFFLGTAIEVEKAMLHFYQSIFVPYIGYLINFLEVSLLYSMNFAKKMKLMMDPIAKTPNRI